MNNELVITQANYESLFAGVRDVITHQPYRIGDRVVRCQHCRAIIRTEFVDARCPMCGASPFVSAYFNNNDSQPGASRPRVVSRRRYRVHRKRWTLNVLLILAVVTSSLPFQFDGFRWFLYGLMPGLDQTAALLGVVGVSAITAVVIACRSRIVNYWKHKRSGVLVVLIPAVGPYLLAALLLLAAFALGMLIAIAAVILVVAIIIGFFAG